MLMLMLTLLWPGAPSSNRKLEESLPVPEPLLLRTHVPAGLSPGSDQDPGPGSDPRSSLIRSTPPDALAALDESAAHKLPPQMACGAARSVCWALLDANDINYWTFLPIKPPGARKSAAVVIERIINKMASGPRLNRK